MRAITRPLDITRTAPFWSWAAPLAAWIAIIFRGGAVSAPLMAILMGLLLFPAVLAAVHHAEVIAVKVGEPFGTLVLALPVQCSNIRNPC